MNRESLELLRKCLAELDVELTANEIGRFAAFGNELKKWNRKINLTAIRGDRDIVIKHFVDSLTLLGRIGKTGTMLDIGSGGGFPAIPIKIMCPQLSVVSVDAVEKKIFFQRHAARELHFHGFTALHVRGEELAKSHAGHFDWIVSRAFADLSYFAFVAKPLLKNTGHIIAMKGKEGRAEAEACEKQLLEIGVRVTDCVHLKLPVTGDDRCLVIMVKQLE
ncbi:MAG TPA: 16S rRNA (guanine(527)-N(7))-methyltransferase RsmG [Geobacteraceae bacterium]|nr:16S rRNA (guanine(527)-N(7))-methyltransferase RsmG [Geobacteraceae bacterium]